MSPHTPAACAAATVADQLLTDRLLTDRLLTDRLITDRLLAERIVCLTGEVDDAAADRVTAQLLLLAADDPARDITVTLRCRGGSVTAALAIHDTMQFVAPDVATWAVGLVASTGQFLLSAGAPGKRYALPHARIVVHRPRLDGASGGTLDAEVFGALTREIAELTAAHSGRPVETVVADGGRWFTAEQAREHGLVDHVTGRTGPAGPTRRIGFLRQDLGNPGG